MALGLYSVNGSNFALTPEQAAEHGAEPVLQSEEPVLQSDGAPTPETGSTLAGPQGPGNIMTQQYGGSVYTSNTGEQYDPRTSRQSMRNIRVSGDGLTKTQLGIEEWGATPEVQAHWQPLTREEAIPDVTAEDRFNLAERERSLVRDDRDITFQDNLAKQEAYAEKQRYIDNAAHEAEVRALEEREFVKRDRADLDEQFAKHRALILKGTDPWRSFDGGSPSGKIAAALSLMTTTMAGPEYAAQGHALLGRIIDNEVSRQKFAIETQGEAHDNAYKRLRTSLGDRDMAEAALTALLLEGSKVKLEMIASQTDDPKAQQAANEAILEIDKRALAENEKYRILSMGRIREQFIPYQAPRSAGSRFNFKLWKDAQETMAGLGKTQLETATLARNLAGGNAQAVWDSIPDRTKSGYSERQAAIEALGEVLGKVGLAHNPRDNTLHGTMNTDVSGVGMETTFLPEAMRDEDAQELNTKLENAKRVYKLFLQGQSSTAGERSQSAYLDGWTEGVILSKVKSLYEILASNQNTQVDASLTPAQKKVLVDNYIANKKVEIHPGYSDEL